MSRSPGRSDSEGVSLDRVFRCLSNPTRRRILTTIADCESLEDAEFEVRDFVPRNVPPGRFRLKLYHRDLPRLRAAKLVSWDPDSGTITPGPNFRDVEPLISLLGANQELLPDRWP